MMDIIKRLEADSDLLSHCLHQRLDKGTSYITAGDINRLGETGLAARQEIDSLRADNEALRAENAELVECLDAIVDTYVANRDSESELGGEFIACITPKHASHMTKKERKESRVWSLFDKARALIAKHQAKGVDDGE